MIKAKYAVRDDDAGFEFAWFQVEDDAKDFLSFVQGIDPEVRFSVVAVEQ